MVGRSGLPSAGQIFQDDLSQARRKQTEDLNQQMGTLRERESTPRAPGPWLASSLLLLSSWLEGYDELLSQDTTPRAPERPQRESPKQNTWALLFPWMRLVDLQPDSAGKSAGKSFHRWDLGVREQNPPNPVQGGRWTALKGSANDVCIPLLCNTELERLQVQLVHWKCCMVFSTCVLESLYCKWLPHPAF